MSKIFLTHGLPRSLRTDNGLQFISHHFKGYIEKMVLNIDEQHRYGHRPKETLKGRTALF